MYKSNCNNCEHLAFKEMNYTLTKVCKAHGCRVVNDAYNGTCAYFELNHILDPNDIEP